MAAWGGWVLSPAGAPPVGFVGSVAATSWQPGRFDLFVRGCDQALWHAGYDGTWHPWDTLGGQLTASPAAVSWAPNRLDVVVRGTDGALWHRFYTGVWSAWESLGGQLMDGNPALTSFGVNRLDVFVVGTNSALWHKWYDGSWHDWENLGGTVQGTPGACAPLGNQIDLYAIANDNTVTHKHYAAGVWGAFTAIPGNWQLGVAVTVRVLVNQIDVFGLTAAGVLQHAWTTNGGATYNYEVLDGTLVSPIGAVTDDSNADLDLFGCGVDGLIYQKSYR